MRYIAYAFWRTCKKPCSLKRWKSIPHMRYIGGALYRICDMCFIQNVGWRPVDQVYCIKRHNSSEPAHRELFNMQFFYHYLHNSIVLYRFGWISMGNARNRGRKSVRKVLTPEEVENKKQKKGKIEEIVDIHYMRK